MPCKNQIMDSVNAALKSGGGGGEESPTENCGSSMCDHEDPPFYTLAICKTFISAFFQFSRPCFHRLSQISRNLKLQSLKIGKGNWSLKLGKNSVRKARFWLEFKIHLGPKFSSGPFMYIHKLFCLTLLVAHVCVPKWKLSAPPFEIFQ